MRLLTFTAACALLICNALVAQPQPTPIDGKIVIPLSLAPTAAPTPASRAYLLPEYGDMYPGNRVQMFMRTFLENETFFGKDESERREKWRDLPLEKLPAKELASYGGSRLRDADEAARLMHVDWQIWFALRRDGIYTLLPELQKMRAVADALRTRLRGEILARDFPKAIDTTRTLLSLARTCDEHPTLIGSLVGASIASIACDCLEELIQQPGCPNLFWGFTDLPVPFIDMRLAFQGERLLISAQYKSLMQATGPLSEAELNKILKEFHEMMAMAEANPGRFDTPAIRYALWASDPKRVELARRRLIETGFDAKVVAAMPILQAVMTDDIRQYEVWRDELFKWVHLPAWQANGMKAVEADLNKHKADLFLAPQLVPAIAKVRDARTRMDQRIAYLRIVEAVRLHAHENVTLPATLDDVKLPLPMDPTTGKAFLYTIKDGIATLMGSNTPGNERPVRVYEIRLRK